MWTDPMAEIHLEPNGGGLRVGVAVSAFNESITEGLLAGALAALESAGVADPTIVWVPGAFELPVVARALAEAGYDAVVAVGAVVLGETDHYTHVATQCAAGLRQVAAATGVPVTFGVLTAREVQQARERSLPGPGNKGREAAEAAVLVANAIRRIRSGGKHN
jgi:6,7-dimethyl-8-ribityllumazine synthase